MAQQPILTVSAAVEAFDVERRALQKMLSGDRIPGAYKDSRGRWLVPVASLHQAGIKARKTWISDANDVQKFANNDANGNTSPGQKFANGTNPPHEINDFDANGSANNNGSREQKFANDQRVEIMELRHQLELKTMLVEQLNLRVDGLQQALRMIESGQPRTVTEPEPTVQKDAEPRRRWWKRRG